MPNMVDYLNWYGNLTFRQVPFNEVDALILAQLSYVALAGTVPTVESHGSVTVSDAATRFRTLHDKSEIYGKPGVVSPLTSFLLQHMAAGARFRDAKLSNFRSRLNRDTAEQFAALHVTLPDRSTYVSFRGTDDTLVGWREDFDMTYTVIPSQTDAVAYLNETCRHVRGPLHVGGHSKGANLAVYAASLCSPKVADKIVDVWNMDGPGFDPAILPESVMAHLRGRIRTYVPEFDIVGQLLSRTRPTKIVKSDERGIMEHSAMSWQVLGPAFKTAGKLDPESVSICAVINKWLSGKNVAQRREITDLFFGALKDAGATSLSDLMTPDAALYTKILANVAKAPSEYRDDVTQLFTELLGTFVSEKTTATVEAALDGTKKMLEPAAPDPHGPLKESELWAYRKRQDFKNAVAGMMTFFGPTPKAQAVTISTLVVCASAGIISVNLFKNHLRKGR